MLKYAFITEKATVQIDKDNKLHFIVDIDDTKDGIRKAVEEIYDVTVTDIKTMITPKGLKKAIVTLSSDNSAEEIASRVGVF
jgi:large subunit ribosomal protein L23